MRYMLGMKFRNIAAIEGVSASETGQSFKSAIKKLQKYFKKKKWTREGL